MMGFIRLIRSALKVLIMFGFVLGTLTINPGDATAVEIKACPPERIGAPAQEESARLSVFADLIGSWKGQGLQFNSAAG